MSDMFQSILDTHPDYICRFDADRVFTYANQAAVDFFRMDRDALIGSRLLDRVPPDQRSEVDSRLTLLSERSPASTTLHKVMRDQRPVHILWTNIAVYDEGRLVGYQSVGRDVSAETALRREIREQAKTLERVQRELRMVLDAVPSRIWYKDDKNTILRLNAAAADSMGLSVEETEGQNTYDLFGEAAKAYHDDDLAVINSGVALRGKIEPYTPNEGDPGWVQTDKIPLELNGPEDRRILVVSTDITDLKEKETLLASINRNLDDFASLTSHDLQAPLRKIGISAELLTLEHGEALPDGASEHLEEIERGVRHMRGLIRSFLKFMRASPHEVDFDTVDLGQILEDSAARERDAISDAGGTVILPDGPISVSGNADLLGQVFGNLFQNALKYRSPDRPLRVEVTAQRALQNWVVDVIDNGRGIDSDEHDKVFDLFGRSQPQKGVKGSGIGLALCRRIIALHGGSIDLVERDGPGATFRIHLNARRRNE